METLDQSPFSTLIGPITVTWDPVPVFETLLRSDCVNSMGRAHGGFVAALIDVAAGQGVKRILNDGRSLVTATTNVQYLGPAKEGERLSIGVRVEHDTRRLVFASCRVSAESRPVANASVVFSARSSSVG